MFELLPRNRDGNPGLFALEGVAGAAKIWGCGAAGSAPAWHAGGQGFESPQLHRMIRRNRKIPADFFVPGSLAANPLACPRIAPGELAAARISGSIGASGDCGLGYSGCFTEDLTPGQMRGCGAAGSAPAWHAGGQGFESPQLHQTKGTTGCGGSLFCTTHLVPKIWYPWPGTCYRR
jgi:hypothetical protein